MVTILMCVGAVAALLVVWVVVAAVRRALREENE